MTEEPTHDNTTTPDASPNDGPDAPPAAPTEHAKISPGYRLRIGLMSLMLIGWSAYCYYDAFHGFPKHDERVRRVEPKLEEFKTRYSDRQWVEQWNQQLHEPSTGVDVPPEQHWPSAADAEKLVNKGEHTQFTYGFNYVMLALSLPFGVLYLIGYFRAAGRWIHMDDAGFTTHTGRAAPFDKITKLNKERWRNKGIAVVHYAAGDGRDGTLVLDDWKFEREPIERMMLAVQARLSPEQIIGDKPPLAELVDPDDDAGDAGSQHDETAEDTEAGSTSGKAEA
jgi:hypothetical protein